MTTVRFTDVGARSRRLSRSGRVAAGAVLVLTFAIAIACSSDREAIDGPRGSVTELEEPREAVSEHLMVALGQAKNFHHQADVYLREARVEDAIAAIRQILDIDFPAASPEADDVRLDARARLGKLLVAEGKLDEALEVVDQGLGETRRESFFVANLYTVRGEIHDARAALLAGDDADRAAAASRAALTDFARSIEINEALLEGLGDGDVP